MPDQLTDVMAGAPDPILDERENQLWDKIMKGPRERAKELAAEEWKRRYGITETSGKGRRFLGGLGEVLRGVGAGKDYQSIPDQAVERGTKEYQAEIGPLQREMGVISNAKTAAARLQQKTVHDEEMRAVAQYKARVAGAKSEAERQMIVSLTPERVKKLAAETAGIEMRTEGQSLKNDSEDMANQAQQRTGGIRLKGDPANAFGVSQFGVTDPGGATDLMKTLEAFGRAKQAGKVVQGSGEKRTVALPTERMAQGFGADGRLHTELVPGTRYVRETVPGSKTVNTGLSEADFPWNQKVNSQNQGPDLPTVAPTAVSPGPTPQSRVVRQTDGTEYVSEPSKQKPVFQNGTYRQRIDPTHVVRLSTLTGIPEEKLAKFATNRFTDRIGGQLKAPTQDALNHRAYVQSVNQLERAVIPEYINGKFDNIGGFINNFMNDIRAVSGSLPPEAIDIRQQGVDVIGRKILELSGKAVTNREMTLYMRGLPNLGTDNASTIVAKSMILKHMLTVHQLQDDLRLTDGEMDRVFQTPAGAKLASLAADNFRILDKAREVFTAPPGSPEAGKKIKIGEKEYDPQTAVKAAKESNSSQNLVKLMKVAMKQAGINDVVPLD